MKSSFRFITFVTMLLMLTLSAFFCSACASIPVTTWEDYLKEQKEFEYVAFIDLDKDGRMEMLAAAGGERYPGKPISLLVLERNGSVSRYDRIGTYRELMYDRSDNSLVVIHREPSDESYSVHRLNRGVLTSEYYGFYMDYIDSTLNRVPYKGFSVASNGKPVWFSTAPDAMDSCTVIDNSEFELLWARNKDKNDLESIHLTPTYELMHYASDSYELSFYRGLTLGYYIYQVSVLKSYSEDTRNEMIELFHQFSDDPSPENFAQIIVLLFQQTTVYEDLQYGKNAQAFLNGAYIGEQIEIFRMIHARRRMSNQLYDDYLIELKHLLENPEENTDHYWTFVGDTVNVLKASS